MICRSRFSLLSQISFSSTLLLGKVIDTGGMSYPQYVLPAILIQVIFLGGLTTVERAARDERLTSGSGSGPFPYPPWHR